MNYSNFAWFFMFLVDWHGSCLEVGWAHAEGLAVWGFGPEPSLAAKTWCWWHPRRFAWGRCHSVSQLFAGGKGMRRVRPSWGEGGPEGGRTIEA